MDLAEIIEITDLAAPELELFANLTEVQLRNRLEPEKGIFIAESPKVIELALRYGYEPVAFLMERKRITGQAKEILARCGQVPVYTGDRELLAHLAGYTLTRGVLCAMMDRASRSCWAALVAKPRRRLWPAKFASFSPIFLMYFFTMRATDLSESCVSRSSLLRLKGLNSGPVWIWDTRIHCSTARTAQVWGFGA